MDSCHWECDGLVYQPFERSYLHCLFQICWNQWYVFFFSILRLRIFSLMMMDFCLAGFYVRFNTEQGDIPLMTVSGIFHPKMGSILFCSLIVFVYQTIHIKYRSQRHIHHCVRADQRHHGEACPRSMQCATTLSQG